jgi:hypothetical protein
MGEILRYYLRVWVATPLEIERVAADAGLTRAQLVFLSSYYEAW